MPLKLVKKIMDEVCSKSFKYKIVCSYVGENGEATLHPDFLDILREINKGGYPVGMFTNFSKLTPDMSKAIIEENLLLGIDTNIDGLYPKSYKLMKGLDYTRVEGNVLAFLYFREKHGSGIPRLTIHIITEERYIKAVDEWFGTYPHKMPRLESMIENEAELIREKWLQRISHEDKVSSYQCLMWAERDYTDRKEGDFSCPNINRLETCAFIAPNGDWYLCCFDEKNQLVIGNLYEQSLEEIYESDRRKNIIQLLKEKRFNEIGLPCSRVDACVGV
jgi:radical SAM protein with 4Fe4S-binding SPASM domain